MKIDELRKLSTDELVNKSNELVNEFKKIKFSLKSGDITPEHINKSRELKKNIAQIKTIISEISLIQK